MPFPLRTRTRGRPSRNAGVVNVAAAPSFNPLTDWTTDPVHGVWASDPAWTPPADGGAVSSWRNGGTVGGDLVQATGSKQPTYRAATVAFNSKPTVQGDGTDDLLAVDTATYAQTWWVVMIAARGKAVGLNEVLWDNIAGAASTSVFSQGSVWRLSASTQIMGGTPDTNPHLIVGKAAGASSSLTIDGTTVASGNAGTSSITGITLFAERSQAAGYFSSGHIAYAALFTTDPTALPEWAAFKAWVLSEYGITVA